MDCKFTVATILLVLMVEILTAAQTHHERKEAHHRDGPHVGLFVGHYNDQFNNDCVIV